MSFTKGEKSPSFQFSPSWKLDNLSEPQMNDLFDIFLTLFSWHLFFITCPMFFFWDAQHFWSKITFPTPPPRLWPCHASKSRVKATSPKASRCHPGPCPVYFLRSTKKMWGWKMRFRRVLMKRTRKIKQRDNKSDSCEKKRFRQINLNELPVPITPLKNAWPFYSKCSK